MKKSVMMYTNPSLTTPGLSCIQYSIHHGLLLGAIYQSLQQKISITQQPYKILMLFPFFCLLSSSLHWTVWNVPCPYLHCFLGFVTDIKCFGGSLADDVFVLCWGTFSGSLALLSPSSPLPAFSVGGLICEQDKLFSPLLSLLALSCCFSHWA